MTHSIRPSCTRSIALVGMRGAGKSTVGRLLAKQLGGTWVDTDDLVEELAGKCVSRVFDEEGELGFRRLELKAVAQAVAQAEASSLTVISVGGGAVLDERNVTALRSVATVIWLVAPPQVLWQRVSADPRSRERRPPLIDWGAETEFDQLLKDRSRAYSLCADTTIETSGKSPEAVVEEIRNRVSPLAL